MRQTRVEALFEDNAADLQLRILAGREGLQKIITVPRIQKPGLALTGYTDFVQQGRLQILGSTELTYLEKLSDEARAASVKTFCQCDVPAVVCTKGLDVP